MTEDVERNSSFGNFHFGRNTTISSDELRQARESRAAEALNMKDDQIRILSQQISMLSESVKKLEEELNTIHLEKIAVESENRSVRDLNFELQSKSRAADTNSKRMHSEVTAMGQQIRTLTDQNSELVRLLDSEDVSSAQLQGEVSKLRSELDDLLQKYKMLLKTAKTHEEMSIKSAKEGQLRAEEIRLLRVETTLLKQQNTEMKMKTQVEVESLQEQLRVRKEKLYQYMEKLQVHEEAKRQAEDQVAGMEEQLRGLHARNVDFEEQMKVQSRSKSNVDEANKELQIENSNLFEANRELQSKIEKSERERGRMESEARDSGAKVLEISAKVFQLMESLKLAQLGKSKAMEALKKKELDMTGIQKKNARLLKETADEAKARVKAELDLQVSMEQVRALKKSNATLAQKSKDEALAKVKAIEQCEHLKEEKKSSDARISFLFSKVQADEEARAIQTEGTKKLKAQVSSYMQKCDELQHTVTDIGESNRVITQAMRLKQEELNEVTAKYDHLLKQTQLRDTHLDTHAGIQKQHESSDETFGVRPGDPDDVANVRLNEGRGRFYVEAKSTAGGGSLLLLKARKPLFRDWLDRFGVNEFLKNAQKTTRFRDLVVERFAAVYGLLMVEEEEKAMLSDQIGTCAEQIDLLQNKVAFIQQTLSVEEDAKRRMLLRYIHSVKEHAMSDGGAGGAGAGAGAGAVLQLSESNIADEEIHALAALLRNNTTIEELHLRGNGISDDGARALGALLAGRSGLRLVDLRGNKIGDGAIRILAEDLTRSERVRHVHVRTNGKIEALGIVNDNDSRWAHSRVISHEINIGSALQHTDNVVTVCTVDVRDNHPETISKSHELQLNDPHSGGTFHPSDLADSVGVPRLNQLQSSPPRQQRPQLSKQPSKQHGSKSNILSKSTSILLITEKKLKHKVYDDTLLAVKEATWQGRAGGIDIAPNNDAELSLPRRKHGQRAELPPITTTGENMTLSLVNNGSPSDRPLSSTAQKSSPYDVAFSGNPESLLLPLRPGSVSAQHSKKTKKQLSETEKRLLNSPLSKPVIGK